MSGFRVRSLQPPATFGTNPGPQHRQHLFRIDRFRQVVPSSGLDALLAIALHRLGRDRDDRQLFEDAEFRESPASYPAHRIPAS